MTIQLQNSIEELKKKILGLSALVEDHIVKALDSFMNRDVDLAKKIIKSDDEIDQMEIEVEELCLRILALHQPVATDLRFVVSCLKINESLERMGDIACNIAKKGKILSSMVIPSDLVDPITEMAELAREMVRQSIDSLVQAASDVARGVCKRDDVLDNLRRQTQHRIMDRIREDTEQLDVWMALFTIVRHLERLGDMATAIAEDVIYLLEGDIIRHAPK